MKETTEGTSNMTRPKISVIVPVYKVEFYLRRCVDSILAQTLTDFELILVDDGSPDNSGAICDEYVLKEARVRVIHKENGGVSSARNAGIEEARGEWLCFVDSDDAVDNDYLCKMYCGIEECGNKCLVMTGYKCVDQNENVISEQSFMQNETTNDIVSAIDKAENFNIINSPVCKLFNTSIVYAKRLRFDQTISYGEDHLFVLDYIKYVDRVRLLKGVYYIYYQTGKESLTSSKSNTIKFVVYVEHLKEKYRELSDILKSKQFDELKDNRLYEHIVRALQFYLTSGEKGKRPVFEKLYAINKKLYHVKPSSLFYKLIFQSLKLPKNMSFHAAKLLCCMKKQIVS